MCTQKHTRTHMQKHHKRALEGVCDESQSLEINMWLTGALTQANAAPLTKRISLQNVSGWENAQKLEHIHSTYKHRPGHKHSHASHKTYKHTDLHVI